MGAGLTWRNRCLMAAVFRGAGMLEDSQEKKTKSSGSCGRFIGPVHKGADRSEVAYHVTFWTSSFSFFGHLTRFAKKSSLSILIFHRWPLQEN